MCSEYSMATVTAVSTDSDRLCLTYNRTVILLIDLQQAFTVGSWRKYVAPPPDGVTAITEAFNRCSLLLKNVPPSPLLIFSQCPFMQSSDYSLDPGINSLVRQEYKFVIKPGNDILDADGFESYLDSLLQANPSIDSVLIGGCTLTSCVRVSSCSVYRKYSDRLRVIVSLEMCGARDENYKRLCMACLRKYINRMYIGSCCVECGKEDSVKMSPVERAAEDMRRVGCVVVPGVHFSN